MRMTERLTCPTFPCADVDHDGFAVPTIDVKPKAVRIILISESSPANPRDYYFARGNPLYAATTVQAFRDAGAQVTRLREILDLGVYLTCAVKCAKTGYGIAPGTIHTCSEILDREIGVFEEAQVILLMGDVAIRALNAIAKRLGEPRVIPTGPTYKIRGGHFRFRGARVFPSYLQAGPSFFIEKSKRRMIASDIAAALAITR